MASSDNFWVRLKGKLVRPYAHAAGDRHSEAKDKLEAERGRKPETHGRSDRARTPPGLSRHRGTRREARAGAVVVAELTFGYEAPSMP